MHDTLQHVALKEPIVDDLSKYCVPSRTSVDCSLGDLYDAFAVSEVGQHFFNQPRRYTVKHNLTGDEADAYLGADAHPVLHGVDLSANFLDSLLRSEYDAQTLFYPSDEDIALLHFCAVFHDIGESTHPILSENGLTIVGDIPTGRKTSEDRKHESENRLFLFSSLFPGLDPEFIARAEAIIGHRPAEGGDEFLHALFEAAHDAQMYYTAQIADAAASSMSTGSVTAEALSGLHEEVTDHIVPHLGKNAYLGYIYQILEAHAAQNNGLMHIHTPKTAPYHLNCRQWPPT